LAGTIIVDRIESDASYASSINVAAQVTFSNTVSFSSTASVSGNVSMSNVTANSVTFTGSTSGTTAVRATAVAGTNILTLPAVTGTLGAYPQIYSVTASVASSAMTVTLNPTVLDFRSTPLTSGTVNTRTVSAAISVVVSSGSTLGTVSANVSRIVVLALDNAGTIELAVVNISGGNNLDETTLISTTAEGGAGAADSANVAYSTTARTSLPFRVVGYIESTQATAGTWATAPSTIQGYGGQALAAMSSLGYGQTFQDVSASRAVGTTYYNTTGKPIFVNYVSTAFATCTLMIGGVSIGSQTAPISFVVPAGQSYSITSTTLQKWSEIR
jgi:hypothetical protein